MDFSKFNKFNRFIFIFLGLILLINLLSLLFNRGTAEETLSQEDSSTIDSIIDSTSEDYINALSYPLDYSGWNGQILLRPKNFLTLESYNSLNEGCGLVEGMRIYYSKNLKDIIIVSNKNLQKNDIQRNNFEEAVSIVEGRDFEDADAELDTFKNYCSDASMNVVAELDKNYEGFESSRVVFGVINGKNKFSSELKGIGTYIYAYGKKNDYLVFLSRSAYAEEYISESLFQQCKDERIDDYSCIKKFYDKDASIRSKVETEATNILKTYSFNE